MSADGSLFFIEDAREPVDEAWVHLVSPALAYAICVFEGIPAYRDPAGSIRAFRVDDHVDRLFASMELMGLVPPWSRAEVTERIMHAVRTADLPGDSHIRVMVYPDGETVLTSDDPVRFTVVVRPLGHRSERRAPVQARISHVQRPADTAMPARMKTTANYVNARLAARDVGSRGGGTPILRNAAGNLAEGGTANLFLVCNGKLLTPSTDQSILLGITRDTVLTLARDLGFAVEERPLTDRDAVNADEAFLCGSLAEVTPIAALDDRALASEDADAITVRLAAAYADEVRRGERSDWIRR